jgi:hypothetical protein
MHYAVKKAFGGVKSLCGTNHEDVGAIRKYGSAPRTRNLQLVTCPQCISIARPVRSEHQETTDRRKGERRADDRVKIMDLSRPSDRRKAG